MPVPRKKKEISAKTVEAFGNAADSKPGVVLNEEQIDAFPVSVSFLEGLKRDLDPRAEDKFKSITFPMNEYQHKLFKEFCRLEGRSMKSSFLHIFMPYMEEAIKKQEN